MNKAPGFMLYPDKAFAGTNHLKGVAFKAYWKALWWMWSHGPGQFRMPDTDKGWENATGLKGDSLKKVRAEIMEPDHELLKKRSYKGRGFLVNLGLLKEAKKQRKYHQRQSDIAKVRWANEKQRKGNHATA